MTALVFSGSGALSPAHAGAAQALIEDGFNPEALVGTSGGSQVAAFMAAGHRPSEALELYMKTLPAKIIRPNFGFLFDKYGGAFNIDRLRTAIAPYVPRVFAACKIPLHIITTDKKKKEQFVFSPGETPVAEVPLAIQASCAVPLLFTPVRYQDKVLMDGGVVNNMAVDLLKMPAIGIRVLSKAGVAKRPPRVWLRRIDDVFDTIECMMAEIERKHIEDAVFAKVITVQTSWSAMDFWSMTPTVVEDLYQAGFDAARKKMDSGWTWRSS